MNRSRKLIAAIVAICAVATVAVSAALVLRKQPPIPPQRMSTAKLQSLAASHPTPEILLQLFERCYDSGDRPGALKVARQMVHQFPTDPRSHNALGIAYSVLNDPEAARAAFQNAISLNSRYVDAYVNRARLSLAQGDEQRAINEFDMATAVDPNSASAWTGLGEANAKLYNGPEATEAFQRAIEIAPDRPQAHSHLGAFEAEMGNGDRARPQLKKAEELGERSTTLYEGFAMAYADQPQSQDELKLALQYADKAEQLGSRSGLLYYARGLALQRLGRYDDAIASFKKVMLASDNANGAWIGLSQCYRAQGKTKLADEAAKTGERILAERQHILNLRHEIKVSPNRLDVRLQYGDALISNGQYLMAADQFRYVAIHSPDKPQLWLKAAHAFDLAGEKQLAAYVRGLAAGKPGSSHAGSREPARQTASGGADGSG
ncbi:MAG TPA: tetratricopeptide repeat protein [Chthonomonadaceae bacterium]|nr:tetratricopeptide repeat protein [Chthonomonadaceae bacterium]